MEENFLKQFVREATRGNNILDLIFSNNEQIVSDVETIETLGDSDQKAIKFCHTVKNTVYSNEILVPNFRLANSDQFKIGLSNVKLIQLGRNVRATDLWNSFKRNFFKLLRVVSRQK